MSKDRFLLKRENSIDVIYMNDVIGLYYTPAHKKPNFYINKPLDECLKFLSSNDYDVNKDPHAISVEEQWVLKTIHQQYELSKKEYGNLKKWILEIVE